MRKDPAGWFTSFVMMGFRRRRSKYQRFVPRHLQLEQLEIRRLMTVDTTQVDGADSPNLHFEIVGDQAQQLFTVQTVNDPQLGLQAVLQPAAGQAGNLNSAYNFDVVLDDGDTPVATYQVEATFLTLLDGY